MNEKTLLEAVVLAGELMLVSGAEIYRVEDTMNHMLKRSEYEQTETIVYGTGIFVTLSDPNKEPLTRVKRVAARCTSINRICLVNDVSRHFCEGKITVEEALRQLPEIQAHMKPDDILMITADHGCDPAYTGTGICWCFGVLCAYVRRLPGRLSGGNGSRCLSCDSGMDWKSLEIQRFLL